METYYRKYHGRSGTYTVRMTDAEIEFRRKLGCVLSVTLVPAALFVVFVLASGVLHL